MIYGKDSLSRFNACSNVLSAMAEAFRIGRIAEGMLADTLRGVLL